MRNRNLCMHNRLLNSGKGNQRGKRTTQECRALEQRESYKVNGSVTPYCTSPTTAHLCPPRRRRRRRTTDDRRRHDGRRSHHPPPNNHHPAPINKKQQTTKQWARPETHPPNPWEEVNTNLREKIVQETTAAAVARPVSHGLQRLHSSFVSTSDVRNVAIVLLRVLPAPRNYKQEATSMTKKRSNHWSTTLRIHPH